MAKDKSNSGQFSDGNPGRFAPGRSGNPSGRPKGAGVMAQMIRDKTNNGADLVDFALMVWRGEHPDMATEKSIAWAHDWLSDRGFGKPLQEVDMLLGAVELTPEQQAMLDAIQMTPHERRERMAALRLRMLAATGGPAAAREPDDDAG